MCEAVFKHKSSLSRHKAHVHPPGSVHAQAQEMRLRNMENEIENLRQELHNRPVSSYCNTNNNQNNVNININSFGKEDTSCLTPELITQCIKRTTKGLVELIERLHFDKDTNRNLRATLQHPEHVEYYNGQKWNYAPRNRVMREVVDSGHSIMSEHYESEDLRKSMTISLYNFVDGWMKKMDRSNAATYADAMNEVYCCVLNRTREICESVTGHP